MRDTGGTSLQDMILYMDKSVIVLNKPPGLATQGGSGLTRHVDGMLDQLAFEKNQRPNLVHRLDRDTSGVLVIARTAPAAAVAGQVAGAARCLQSLLGADPRRAAAEARHGQGGAGQGRRARQHERMAIDRRATSAKYAITDYAVIDRAGEEFAWVAAKPVTGRTHQIRVHLASLGTPIVGDFKYGGTAARGKGAIADKLHLHARSIDIARPDGGRLDVTAPLPQHMLKSWELLGFDPDSDRDYFAKSRKR